MKRLKKIETSVGSVSIKVSSCIEFYIAYVRISHI